MMVLNLTPKPTLSSITNSNLPTNRYYAFINHLASQCLCIVASQYGEVVIIELMDTQPRLRLGMQVPRGMPEPHFNAQHSIYFY